MNKDRLKQINEIIKNIDNISGEIENVLDEEQFSFDNMPENLQSSSNGERSEDAIGNLEEAHEKIQEVKESLECIY